MPYLRLTCPALPPTDFAVGGLLLVDRIPRVARLAKRLG